MVLARELRESLRWVERKIGQRTNHIGLPKLVRNLLRRSGCKHGRGRAVLSQVDAASGNLRPIRYFSSALTAAQRNYSEAQLDAWALVAPARKWAVYLRAAPEVVFLTDHCPLQWLRRQKDPRHTYTRWILELEELPYRVKYRPGRQNCTADYLSRTPDLRLDMCINNEEPFENKIYLLGQPEEIRNLILDKQRGDPVIQHAINQLHSHGFIREGQLKHMSRRLRIWGDFLCFDERLVVPKELQNDILEKVDNQTHFGQVAPSKH